jgi:hypothetical protein
MRYRIAFAIMSVALLVFILGPQSTLGQGKKGKGFGGGFGGPGGGGFGGGFGKGPGPNNDPNQMFDFLSRGRGYFLVTDSQRLNNLGLGQYLQQKGITSGQVTRDVFIAFNQQVNSGMDGGGFQGGGGFGPGGFGGFGGGGFGGFGKGNFGGQGGNPIDAVSQMAESDFRVKDRNGDGFLNMDEMPLDLKSELGRWDQNRDNVISLEEYKSYYVTKVQERRGGNQQVDPITIIIEEENLDARVTVYRAGKLPQGLPKWFKELDTDRDGQVALYEWHKAGRDIDEFREWDRNDDGFISPEEALYKQNLILVASTNAKAEDDDDSPGPAMRAGGGKKGNFGNGNFEFAGKGKGDFFKGKGKGGGGKGKGGGGFGGTQARGGQ